MNQSKMIFVFNHSFYLLIALVFTCFYLETKSIIFILLLTLYIIFLLKKSLKVFIISLFIMIIFYSSYMIQHNWLIQAEKSHNIVCIIKTIPDKRVNYSKFNCKTKKNNILVYLYDTDIELKLGDKIQIDNQLEPIKNNTVPNQFNYAKYLKSNRIFYQNQINEVKIISHHNRMDYRLINYLIDYYKDSDVKEYILSFLIGEKNALDDEFKDNIQTLNISHLFVVSGFHVGFLYLALKFIFKHLKVSKEHSEIITSFGLILFLILNQFSISILRAVGFIIGIQWKNKYKYPIENVNILSIIALVNLIINPFVIYHAGFVLSYLITLSLLLSQSLLKKSSSFVNLIKVNIIAQLFSLPIIANFNFNYNFISIMTTPFLCIYYTFVIFPFTIVCIILKPLSLPLSHFFHLYENCLSTLSKVSMFIYNIGSFDEHRTFFYYFFLVLFLIKIERKHFSTMYATFIIVIALFYHTLSLSSEVTFIDVGQGDSIFIRSQFNRCTALIDTGGSIYYHPGEKVKDYLKSIQVRHIDVLFLTHSDMDHIGDYEYIIHHFNVKTIVFNAYDDGEELRQIERHAKMKKKNILKLKAYNKVDCGQLSFSILNPSKKNNTINDNSLVLFLIFNGQKYLFMGDASSDSLISVKDNQIDFLKVSHHGSKYQTNQAFFNTYDVQHAIISVGKNNYHHPSKELLNLLDINDVSYYRTDIHGTISVKYYLGKKRMIYTYRPYNIYASFVLLDH